MENDGQTPHVAADADSAGHRYGARLKAPGGLNRTLYIRVTQELQDHLQAARDRIAAETKNPKLAVADVVREALWKVGQ